MKIVNHYTVGAMKTVGTKDTLKIEHEGTQSKNFNFFLHFKVFQ